MIMKTSLRSAALFLATAAALAAAEPPNILFAIADDWGVRTHFVP